MNLLSQVASELLEDEELMSDVDRYTCHIMQDRVAALAPHIHSYDVESYIVNKGREFLHAINDDPYLLGYELNATMKDAISDYVLSNWVGAFVHVLSRGDRCIDINAFTLCRKAWLKFIVDSNDEISE